MHLSLVDLVALAFFISVWGVYAVATSKTVFGRVSLTAAMDAQREEWMRLMARRDLRMIDTGIMLGLQQGTAFFASSALLAVGGCFALIGASDQVLTVIGDLPYAGTPSRPAFEVKVAGLILVLSYAFFKFGWAYRLFNYCSILIGAVPLPKDDSVSPGQTDAAVRRAARMNILGGKHFNAGLRGIFFSIGYLGWFVDARVFALSTFLVMAVLVRRQFFSAARRAVLESASSG